MVRVAFVDGGEVVNYYEAESTDALPKALPAWNGKSWGLEQILGHVGNNGFATFWFYLPVDRERPVPNGLPYDKTHHSGILLAAG